MYKHTFYALYVLYDMVFSACKSKNPHFLFIQTFANSNQIFVNVAEENA